MTGPRQLKRVSWAPGVNLCQVRLFLSEDAPWQSAVGSQDHLQAKAAWLLHSSSAVSDDSVPPGFESHHMGQIGRNIPSIKWQCPPNQLLKPEWQVVAGEESQEVALQNRRQLGALEAVYPRLSSIPPEPSVSPEAQLAPIDDSHVPLIPIIAKEDEDASEQDTAPENSLPVIMPPNLSQDQQQQSAAASHRSGTSVEPDIAAAASAAFTAIMRSNEEGSLIDRDLLIKILCDPTMLEKLASEHTVPKQASNAAVLTPALNLDVLPLCSPPIPTLMTALPVKPPPAKDMNYYKSLIQKHGGDRQEMPEPVSRPYESNHDYQNNPLGSIYREGARNEGRHCQSRNPKIAKPCAYFNSPRGCRQGVSCSYLHDSSASKNSYFLSSSSTSKKTKEQRGAKRIKFDW